MKRRRDKLDRVPYAISVTPQTRDALRKWAYENDRPASEAIELMTAQHLETLKPTTTTA